MAKEKKTSAWLWTGKPWSTIPATSPSSPRSTWQKMLSKPAQQHAQAGAGLLNIFCHVERGELGLVAGMGLQGFAVQSPGLVFFSFAMFDLFVEPALGFVA